MDKRKTALIHAAIAGVLAVGTVTISPSARAETHCYGINSCKGTGACGSKATGASCAGSNACKGQGFMNVASEDECKTKGGYLTEADAMAALKKSDKKAVAKNKAKAKKKAKAKAKEATTETPAEEAVAE